MKFNILALVLYFSISLSAFAGKAEQLPEAVVTIDTDVTIDFLPLPRYDRICDPNANCFGAAGPGRVVIPFHGENDGAPGKLVLDDGSPIDYSAFVHTSKGIENKISLTIKSLDEPTQLMCVLEIILDEDTSKILSTRWTTNQTHQSNPAEAVSTCSFRTEGQNIFITIAKQSSAAS